MSLKVRDFSDVICSPISGSFRLSVACLFLFCCTSTLFAQDPAASLAQGKELFNNVQFQEALSKFDEVITRASSYVDKDVRSEALLWRAYCDFKITSEFTEKSRFDLRESVKLRRNYRVSREDFPPDIVNAYDKARSEVLSTIIIRSVSPGGAILSIDGSEITAPFVDSSIVSGPVSIMAKKQGYATFQKQLDCEPGRVYEIPITLDYAYGSLKVSSSPEAEIYLNDSLAGQTEYPIRLQVGDYRVTVRGKYYEDTTITLSVAENSETRTAVTLRTKPAFAAMLKDKAEYGGKKRTNTLLKISTLAAAAGATAFAVINHSAANNSYDKYVSSITAQDMNKNYKDYESKLSLRNIAGAAAIGFAALEVIWFLTAPDRPSENLDDYAPKLEKLSLTVKSDHSITYIKVGFVIQHL